MPPLQPMPNPFSSPSEQCFLDSGATNHLTSDINNLVSHAAYTGGDQIRVGNGEGLYITNPGSLSITTSDQPLLLHKVLRAKNLLSISQLTRNNDVIVVIHPLRSNFPLLRAKLEDGLYCISSSLGLSLLLSFLENVFQLRCGTAGLVKYVGGQEGLDELHEVPILRA